MSRTKTHYYFLIVPQNKSIYYFSLNSGKCSDKKKLFEQFQNAYSGCSSISSPFSHVCRTQRHSVRRFFNGDGGGAFFRRIAMCRSLDGNFGVFRINFGWTWIAFGIIAPSVFFVSICDAFKLFALAASLPASLQSLNLCTMSAWFKWTLSKAWQILSSVVEGELLIATTRDLLMKRIFLPFKYSLTVWSAASKHTSMMNESYCSVEYYRKE